MKLNSMAMNQSKQFLRVTLVRSKYGRLRKHQACLQGLGIRRMHKPVTVEDTRCTRGMINQVSYMLRVEEA